VYVWGWNDNGQCGKSEELCQIEIRNNFGARSAQVPLEEVVGYSKESKMATGINAE